jgi:hypothetical protein
MTSKKLTRRTFRHVLLRVGAALLPVLIPALAVAEAGGPGTVRDAIWVWGNAEMAEPGEQTLATYAQASPAGRSKLMGVPNIVMGGFGLPDDDGEAQAIVADAAGAKRLVLKIKSDGAPAGGYQEGSAHFVYGEAIPRVVRLVDQYPQVQAVLLDDVSTVLLREGFKPQFVRSIRSMLPEKHRSVRIWGVVHDESIRAYIHPDRETDYGLSDIIRELDVIALSQWHAKDLVRLEDNVAHLRGLFPDKPIVLSLYLYDYGGRRKMTLDLLESQCETALKLLHAGVVKGIVFTGMINDPPVLAWTADWLKRVGGQKLGSPVVAIANHKRVAAAADSGPQPTKIDKIYFMFHPVCWSILMAGTQPPPSVADVAGKREDFLLAWRREVEVVRRQKRFMSRMKPNEALVLFPISTAKPMRLIRQYATKALGGRCIIIDGVYPQGDRI